MKTILLVPLITVSEATMSMPIAAQGGVFNFAIWLVPIANTVIFWGIAPFFVFIAECNPVKSC